ncbi:hypothetical protein GCM10007989_15820 [Devosia pacifica]|uniref:EAL domain-containing protein n=1 Tax=Devosia pacifica TaxID=1335967 RepID=A0A918S297_9HYPH|nr:EAL domain-containing protein [Devosia pacifica]GHA21335.1 hypothetical protein GCM10007989_15820 [Devosia pacifica]
MSGLTRTGVLLAVVVGCFLLDFAGVFASLHQAIEDARFEATSRAPSGDVVLVEIDATSLGEVGIWPWPRFLHALLLDTLVDSGASRVAFDIDFSASSNPEDDAAFAASLARAEGKAYLAAFRQYSPATQQTSLSLPIAAFAAHAQPVLVNVQRQGTLVTAVTEAIATSEGAIASMPSVLAGGQVRLEGVQEIDFGIDVTKIDRLTAAQVLSGTFDRERVAGKTVIIGATAVELRDFFTAPRFGTIAGPLIQVAATETMLQNRSIIRTGPWLALAAAVLVVGLSGLRRKPKLAPLIGICLAVALASEIAALALLEAFGLLISTAALHLALLAVMVVGLIERLKHEYRRRTEFQARLEFIAHRDVVTGALNRFGLLSELNLRPAAPESQIWLMRLQGADTIGAAFGQTVRDEMLAEIASRLATLEFNSVARVGDETFAVTAPAGCCEASTGAEAIRGVFADQFVSGQHAAHIGVSIAHAHAEADWSAEQLLWAAEMALLTPGASDAISHYSPALREGVERRRLLDGELRRAIGTGQLHLAYQPQICLANGTLHGVEALLRWTHPRLGAISPAEFIPLAEETGFIVELGAWVLQQACETAASNAWLGRISVNISGRQLGRAGFAQDVATIVAASGLDPTRLEVELTESVLSNSPDVLFTLDTLRECGIGIALDDFGTGFSSLSYLATLPFDTLKIDRSFVRDLKEGSPNYKIVKSIVELALALDKKLVAEGMETAEEAQLIGALGCHYAQGYWFGKPALIEDLSVTFKTPRLAG